MLTDLNQLCWSESVSLFKFFSFTFDPLYPVSLSVEVCVCVLLTHFLSHTLSHSFFLSSSRSLSLCLSPYLFLVTVFIFLRVPFFAWHFSPSLPAAFQSRILMAASNHGQAVTVGLTVRFRLRVRHASMGLATSPCKRQWIGQSQVPDAAFSSKFEPTAGQG